MTQILTWEQRRKQMQNVCKACHTPGYFNGISKEAIDKVRQGYE